MEEKYNTNVKYCNLQLNGKKVRRAGDMIIYGYKNIL